METVFFTAMPLGPIEICRAEGHVPGNGSDFRNAGAVHRQRIQEPPLPRQDFRGPKSNRRALSMGDEKKGRLSASLSLFFRTDRFLSHRLKFRHPVRVWKIFGGQKEG